MPTPENSDRSEEQIYREELSKVGRLTEKEMLVGEALVSGLVAKEIAVQLKLSFRTIDAHRQHLFGTLGIYDVETLKKLWPFVKRLREDIKT
jgi:DNA-binding NarL/FixJ family response regulator